MKADKCWFLKIYFYGKNMSRCYFRSWNYVRDKICGSKRLWKQNNEGADEGEERVPLPNVCRSGRKLRFRQTVRKLRQGLLRLGRLPRGPGGDGYKNRELLPGCDDAEKLQQYVIHCEKYFWERRFRLLLKRVKSATIMRVYFPLYCCNDLKKWKGILTRRLIKPYFPRKTCEKIVKFFLVQK